MFVRNRETKPSYSLAIVVIVETTMGRSAMREKKRLFSHVRSEQRKQKVGVKDEASEWRFVWLAGLPFRAVRGCGCYREDAGRVERRASRNGFRTSGERVRYVVVSGFPAGKTCTEPRVP